MKRTKTLALFPIALFALLGADSSSCSGLTPDPGSSTTGGPSPSDEELLTSVDPQALKFASAKATVASCGLYGTIDASQVEPANLDDATVIALMEQYMPSVADQTNQWLASADPSTIQAGVIPKNECIEEHGCEWQPQCKYGFDPGVSHRCIITDCGAKKCSWCPSWVPELLKNLSVKSWCAYVCVQTGISPPPVVAIGVGGISSFGGNFVGPICVAP
jgi:hypothetical protein